MASNSQARAPLRHPSQNGPPNRAVASSPLISHGFAARQMLSSFALQPRAYSASPGMNVTTHANQHATRTVPRPAIYSHQLPSHPQRQRLSLRPSSLRATSASPAQNHVDEDENDNLADDLLDSDASSEVIMAIDMNKTGKLGCAYYIAAEEKLLLLEDVAMGGVEIVETLLLHAKPTTILIPSRTSQVLRDLLSKNSKGDSRHHQQYDEAGAYVLQTLITSKFGYDSAREKLLGLKVQPQSRHTVLFTSVTDGEDFFGGQQGSMQGSLMRLGSSINLDSRLTIGCAGAILGDINRRRMVEHMPGDPDAMVTFRIKSLEMFKLFDSMFVNVDTLASLQILRPEFHPNSQMRGPDKSSTGAKESLSVYGLFHYLACTPQGKSKLRQIFMRPSINIDIIKERQQVISFFIRPDHSESIASLTKELRQVKNMRNIVAFLRKGVDNPAKRPSLTTNIWIALMRFSYNALHIREILTQMQSSESIEVIKKVIDTIQYHPLFHVGELIAQTVDVRQTTERQRTAVKPGVDSNLDELRRTFDAMEDLLTVVKLKLQAELPEWAPRYVLGCVYYPQLGFLTVVSLDPETGQPNYGGEGLDEIWRYMFIDNGVVYCKNRRMKEMDEHFGDVYCMIIDREIEILYELSVQVLKHEDDIFAASDVIGELDSLFALAVGARKYNWVAPLMTPENVLRIEGGRHPLQDLTVPSFVANDCLMTGGSGAQDANSHQNASSVTEDSTSSPSTLVLTGPNHSGKSVYLKQNALIVYLAHIGSYVPAKKATVGVTDRILTRIATRESVSRNQSTFAIDLRQAAFAINFATRQSLVIIDEFGKGTSNVDGAGLMTALLHHFSVLGPERPKVLAATHFHEIFEAGFLQESMELAFAHMDVHVDFNTPRREDQLTYLFRLQPGRSISSFGSMCAAMNGVDEVVVDRAEAIMLLLARGEDLEAACSKLSTEEVTKLRKAEAIARALLERDIKPPRLGGKRLDGYYRSILEGILAAGEESLMSDVS